MSFNKSILIIDDDDDDRDVFCEVVSELNSSINCETAINGDDGLQKLMSFEQLPKLIFLDLNMPLMNGTEFLQKVKASESLKDIPVIIFSTTSDERAIRNVKMLGAIDFITKPDKFKDWRTVIKPFISQV